MTEPTGIPQAVRDMLVTLTAESTATLRSSGVCRLLQPRLHGGLGLPTDEFVSAISEFAAIDGSLGWLAATFSTAAHDVAALPEHAAHEVWGAGPDALVAIGHHGSGALVDGRLTGRWDAVVGAEQADWLLLSADRPPACRVLVPRRAADIAPVGREIGLGAAGIRDLTVSNVAVDQRHVFAIDRGRTVLVTGAGAAAAVVGSADGVWRQHVEQVRTRLATSYGGDEVTNEAAAHIARAASDIDAARLQITSAHRPVVADPLAVGWAHRQAVARARDAADRILGSSRHALDATDPVSHRWKEVHVGCRLTVRLFDHLHPTITR